MSPSPAKRLISVVTPAYNESDCVDELARRLRAVFDDLADRYDFEVIIVENGSRDDTYEKLLSIRDEDPRFKIIQLSRNFYMEGGMVAGIKHATGDACVIMASDLQDPPEMIPEFIAKWEEGYENVYQVVSKRSDNGPFRRAGAASFYWLINKVSDTPVPRNASDYRLVDRRAYETFNAMPERNKMVRAMWGWIGFRSIGIERERPPRHGGRSQFKVFATTGFAIRGILASSRLPLKLIPFFGIGLAFLSFAGLIGYMIRALFFGVPFPGFGTIVCLALLSFGFLFLLLGVVSEYIGMIFEEVRGRPFYVIRETHGLERRDDSRSAEDSALRVSARAG